MHRIAIARSIAAIAAAVSLALVSNGARSSTEDQFYRMTIVDFDVVFSQLNAAALEAMLQGAAGAYRDTVLLNAAAALIVAGQVGDLREGVLRSAHSIASGAALAALESLRRVSAASVS